MSRQSVPGAVGRERKPAYKPGSFAATGVEAWLCWQGVWTHGRWPAISPSLDTAINQHVGVPVNQIAGLMKHQTPFSDFTFDGGMVGVLWDRPDGRWRFALELGARGSSRDGEPRYRRRLWKLNANRGCLLQYESLPEAVDPNS